MIDELNTITSGGELNKEKLAGIERELARLQTEITGTEEKLATGRLELEELVAHDQELNDEMDSVREELRQEVMKYNEHSARATGLSADIEELRGLMIDLSNQNVARRAEISTLSRYQQTLEERSETLKDEFEGRDRAEAANRSNLDRLDADIQRKSVELGTEKEKIFEIANNIISVNKHINELSDEIYDLTDKSTRAAARRSTIEEMEANYEGYNNTVRSLMHRDMKGIIGTVSDIINVPDGYETAVETALGGSLQHIVCETDSDAKSAVSWLKSTRSGRATFLPVESVTADRIDPGSRVKGSTGYLGIASDMVSCDPKFSEITDYLLCRVIIADNMDNAVRMSKSAPGGFRIVTLEGEVINSAGAITGGRYANRSANLLDRKKEISTLTETINGYNRRISELNSEIESEKKRESRLADERDAQRDKVTELEIAYNVLKTDRDHAAEVVEADAGAAERYRNEISNITEDINRADKMISDYRDKIAAAEKEYAQADASAEKLMAELEGLKPVIEDDNEKIVALKVKIGESESKVLSRNEIIERVRDDVTELEEALNDYRESAAELETSKEILTSSGEAQSDRENELKDSRTSLEEKIAELSASQESNRKQAEALANEQKSLRQSLEDTREQKYRLEVKTARNETLFDTQKDKLWDEFEVSYAEALDMRTPDFAITAGNRESREVRLRLAELGDVNISSIEEYKNVSKRYEFMTAQEADLTRAMSELQEIISNMDRTIRTKFKENFDQVVINFEEAFKELFGGGYAELRLEDETRPLESGIEITAQPPGKRLKNINLLSGGEKTLTAIALMFAVLKAKPTPFVILDEVEAALDEVNIENFSNYLKKFDNIQFALITHQKATMEHADVLYGVTMPEQGISRMLSIKLGDEFDAEGLE